MVFDDASKSAMARPSDVEPYMRIMLPETEYLQQAWTSAAVDDHVALGHVFRADTIGAAHSWAPAVEDENFSKWKLCGVTPTPDIHLRTPSTIGGGPQT